MKVRALENMVYAGRDMRAGEEFETESDMHAKLLTLNNKVEMVKEEEKPKRERYKRRDMRADE